MRKAIIRWCVIIISFFAALVVAGDLLNSNNTDMTAVIAESTLPWAYISVDGRVINSQQAFCVTPREATMRGGIVPLDETRKLQVVLVDEEGLIDSIEYQVRSLNGDRLVESNPVGDAFHDGNRWQTRITLKDLIDEKVEYHLVMVMNLKDGRRALSYFRIIQDSSLKMADELAFAEAFSEATFDKEALQDLKQYLEPVRGADNSSLAYVDIHSSVGMVGWGDLEIERLTEPSYTINDLNSETASITAAYQVGYTREEQQFIANVKESFRLRNGKERIYLLDYKRTMNEIYRVESKAINGNQIPLGIVGEAVELKTDTSGRIIAYAQSGELYCLNQKDNKLVRLYSLWKDGEDGEQSLFDLCGYRILKVDDIGNVWFAVCGYMTRGRMEGSLGAEIYYYNSAANVLEEKAFLPAAESPDILRKDLERLFYLNEENQLFVMLDNCISKIDLEENTTEVITDHVLAKDCVVSASNRNAVWQDGGAYDSGSLTLLNLNTGIRTTIEVGSGNLVKPLGFIGEDLVYGIARNSDLGTDETGAVLFPMYQLVIRNEEGETLMNYKKPGIYVEDCELEAGQIFLQLLSREEGAYVAAGQDQIINGTASEDSGKSILKYTDAGSNKKLTSISLPREVDSKKLKNQTPAEILFEGSREQVLKKGMDSARYYAYGIDGSVYVADAEADAVEHGYDMSGVVVDENGAYIWRKEKINTKNQIMAIHGAHADENNSSLGVCLNEILSFAGNGGNTQRRLNRGDTVFEILEEGISDARILDLTGCSLESVLYYPDREKPVLAILADGNAVLVIGFNEQNVVFMNPLEETTVYKVGRNDAAEFFEENGNVFITYVK